MSLTRYSFFSLMLIVLNVSCKDSYYDMNDFGSVKKVDTHVHLNSDDPALAVLAKADNFFLLTINVDVPDYLDVSSQEKFALQQVETSPDQVKYVAAFTLENWDSANWADKTIERLERSFSNGALGVKIWKNIGMVHKNAEGKFVMIDDPKFDPVIRYIISKDKTVLGHLGEPKNCWLPLDQMTVNNDRQYFKENPQYHMFLHPEYPSYDDQINARDRFVEKHPDMRFVGAHLGSLEWDVDELAKRLDKFPNMAVDMAARVPHLQHQSISDRDKVRDFMIKYQDRIIYATDTGISEDSDPAEAKKYVHDRWLADWRYFVTDEKMTVEEVNGEFRGLKLPREVIDKIYRENAIRWFKITSRQ
jgi:hypothetical protein